MFSWSVIPICACERSGKIFCFVGMHGTKTMPKMPTIFPPEICFTFALSVFGCWIPAPLYMAAATYLWEQNNALVVLTKSCYNPTLSVHACSLVIIYFAECIKLLGNYLYTILSHPFFFAPLLLNASYRIGITLFRVMTIWICTKSIQIFMGIAHR